MNRLTSGHHHEGGFWQPKRLPEHQLVVDGPDIPFAEQSRAGPHVIRFSAAGDVDLDVDPVALTVEVLSAVEIIGKDAVDRTSSSPLVRD